MGNKESGLSKLAEAVCVDLSSSTEMVLPTEFQLSELGVGDWFRQQTGFKLPYLAKQLGINQESMLTQGDPEKHLMIFRSQDNLKQVAIKYGVSYKNNQALWFLSGLGISGWNKDRLMAGLWQLKNAHENFKEPAWKLVGVAVSYKDEIRNQDFLESSTESIDSQVGLLRIPWFSETMKEKAGNSRLLLVKEGSYGGVIFGNMNACSAVGFSMVNLAEVMVVSSTRKQDEWKFTIQKKLEPDLV